LQLLLAGGECGIDSPNKFESSAADGRNVYIRGDFGWPYSEEYIDLNQRIKGVDLSIAPYFLKRGSSTSSQIDSNQLKAPAPGSPPSGNPYSSSTLVGGHSLVANGLSRSLNPPLTKGRLFYPWLAPGRDNPGELPAGLLSSWFNPKPLDYKNYEFDSKNLKDHFLKCEYKALKDKPVSSSCVGLGRTGYSVKLISCDEVKTLSDKPDDIDAFCG